jgi:aspartate/methionine/tyrosine aminotransferase
MGLSPYMEWANSRPVARLDLAASNLKACTIDDLPGAREALELSGRNDEGYGPLLEAIASRYGVAADQVAAASGCSGANFLALAAAMSAGDELLIERPAYDPLIGAARLLGATIVRFDRPAADGFAIDSDRVQAAVTPRTRAIVVTTPHNPTGVTIPDETLAALGRIAARSGAILLVDEVYRDVAGACGAPPAARLGDAIVTTNSLTKSYGLSGLRCGWTIASAAITHRIRRARDVVDGTGAFPPDRLARLAFEHLETLHTRGREIVGANLSRAREFLGRRRELECTIGDGPLIFPCLSASATADAFAARLFERYETAVVPGRFFEMPAHFRIALGGDPRMFDEGLSAVEAALGATEWG